MTLQTPRTWAVADADYSPRAPQRRPDGDLYLRQARDAAPARDGDVFTGAPDA